MLDSKKRDAHGLLLILQGKGKKHGPDLLSSDDEEEKSSGSGKPKDDSASDSKDMLKSAMSDFIDAVASKDVEAALSAYQDICDLHKQNSEEEEEEY